MTQLFEWTHKALVLIAYKWAIKNLSIGFAFMELKSIDDEIPDVVGFSSWESFLIEVKVSRGDFLSDMKKPHRKKGMGNWRFYCCPKGLIKREELPEKWGLIYVDEKGKARIEHDCRFKKITQPCEHEWQWREYPSGSYERVVGCHENRHDHDHEAERRIMYSALRRLFIKGHMSSIYDKDYNRHSNRDILYQHETQTTHEH